MPRRRTEDVILPHHFITDVIGSTSPGRFKLSIGDYERELSMPQSMAYHELVGGTITTFLGRAAQADIGRYAQGQNLVASFNMVIARYVSPVFDGFNTGMSFDELRTHNPSVVFVSSYKAVGIFAHSKRFPAVPFRLIGRGNELEYNYLADATFGNAQEVQDVLEYVVRPLEDQFIHFLNKTGRYAPGR